MRKKNKVSNIKNLLGWLVFLIPIVYLSYKAINSSLIAPYRIKTNPVCVNAIVYKEFYPGSHYGPTLKYFFIWADKKYYGSVLKKLSKKTNIGDTICVVFAALDPNVNKPLSYFDNGDIKCNCKQCQWVRQNVQTTTKTVTTGFVNGVYDKNKKQQ